MRRIRKAKNAQAPFVNRRALHVLPHMTLAPLHFRRPSVTVLATTEEKQHLALHSQELKRQHYRQLEESGDVICRSLSATLDILLRLQRSTDTASAANAAAVISSMYWGMRFLLAYPRRHLSPAYKEFFTRGTRMSHTEVSTSALYHYFTLHELTAARERFSPRQLPTIKPNYRASVAWLRHAIPLYHEYYTENPEKYANLSIAPVNTYKAQPSSATVTE